MNSDSAALGAHGAPYKTGQFAAKAAPKLFPYPSTLATCHYRNVERLQPRIAQWCGDAELLRLKWVKILNREQEIQPA